MRLLVGVVTLGLVCSLLVAGRVQPAAIAAKAASMYKPAQVPLPAQPQASTGAAAAMYEVQEVVGTLLTVPQSMYDTGESTWFSAKLRIDRGAPAIKTGSTQPIRYLLPDTIIPEVTPGSGDQIDVKLWQVPGSAEGWSASQAPTVLGRGELLRPGEGAVSDMGSPKAKILVKLLAPLATDCHQKTAQLLKALAAREPDRVRIQLFDMRTVAGRQEMRKERLTCATVLINNRYQFTLDTPNGKRQVTFQHHPNDPKALYNSEDVITAIDQEIKRLYP